MRGNAGRGGGRDNACPRQAEKQHRADIWSACACGTATESAEESGAAFTLATGREVADSKPSSTLRRMAEQQTGFAEAAALGCFHAVHHIGECRQGPKPSLRSDADCAIATETPRHGPKRRPETPTPPKRLGGLDGGAYNQYGCFCQGDFAGQRLVTGWRSRTWCSLGVGWPLWFECSLQRCANGIKNGGWRAYGRQPPKLCGSQNQVYVTRRRALGCLRRNRPPRQAKPATISNQVCVSGMAETGVADVSVKVARGVPFV
jgi:hypothetical protein